MEFAAVNPSRSCQKMGKLKKVPWNGRAGERAQAKQQRAFETTFTVSGYRRFISSAGERDLRSSTTRY